MSNIKKTKNIVWKIKYIGNHSNLLSIYFLNNTIDFKWAKHQTVLNNLPILAYLHQFWTKPWTQVDRPIDTRVHLGKWPLY